jgi:hypothetical protein
LTLNLVLSEMVSQIAAYALAGLGARDKSYDQQNHRQGVRIVHSKLLPDTQNL